MPKYRLSMPSRFAVCPVCFVTEMLSTLIAGSFGLGAREASVCDRSAKRFVQSR